MQTFLKSSAPHNIKEAAALLLQDEVVAIPTETVYGLAASALSDTAVRKIFAAKGRPQDNPLISHIASLEMLPMVASHVPQSAYALADAFWPGPLTMVLPRSEQVADSVCAGLATAAVRMPCHPVALAVINACGVPLAAPSANLSGSPSPTTAADVYADMNGKIPLILDGGACTVGVESTVISLVGETPVLLRPGYITKEELEQVLGTPVLLSSAILHKLKEGEVANSPGMKYKHYAPKANVVLLQGDFAAYQKYVAAHCTADTMSLRGRKRSFRVLQSHTARNTIPPHRHSTCFRHCVRWMQTEPKQHTHVARSRQVSAWRCIIGCCARRHFR
ncbi:MAG: L-threonylcarbamoyladenylate synthase [Ruthenibacterium sp.]